MPFPFDFLARLARPVAQGAQKLPHLLGGEGAQLTRPGAQTPPFVPRETGLGLGALLADAPRAAKLQPPGGVPASPAPVPTAQAPASFGSLLPPRLLPAPPPNSEPGGVAALPAPAARPRVVNPPPAPATIERPSLPPNPATPEVDALGTGRPRFADPIRNAEDQYVYQDGAALARPTAGLRFKEALKTALAGAAQGYATTGTAGGALGGALAGGAGGAINPAAGRAAQFGILQKPGVRADVEWQDARRKSQLGQALEEARIRTETAQGDNYRSIIQDREARTQRDASMDEATLRLKGLERERRQLELELARETRPYKVQELQARLKQIAAQTESSLASAERSRAIAASGGRATSGGADRARRAAEGALNRAQAAINKARELDARSPNSPRAKAAWESARAVVGQAVSAHPGLLEGGEGAGGYPFIKPAAQARPASGAGTSRPPADAVRRHADRLREQLLGEGFSEDEVKAALSEYGVSR
jgi:hypothetical protein